ncbi:malate synthase G [Corynebacterium propinquum]|uniref:malate synthase G n=1 Tax=Corynebacterium propinquum TaxID=43769 RepID=UPI0025408D92|nr:malate synthase G [Corynebacterium propinquum]MDK4235879.1 malate synthase G [Corynebacterium propinquum]
MTNEDTTPRTEVAGLNVDNTLYEFVNGTVLPRIGIDADKFWNGFADIIRTHTPRNKELLARRDELQKTLDEHFRTNPGQPDPAEHEKYLREIGYLEDKPAPADVTTANLDSEIAEVAGPQLVVPVLNARFALNAANARWGSLYDALYGTDAISEEGGAEPGDSYNPVRGDKVIAWARNFLDEVAPLENGSHADAESYAIDGDKLTVTVNGSTTSLANAEQLVGFNGEKSAPSEVVLRNNGLHILIQINPEHPVGKTDKAGVSDVILESATSTIVDFEDSVAAVDGEDKTLGYYNWFGLNTGELKEELEKGGKTITRKLNDDRTYTDLSGNEQTLHGRALLLVRNVGHLMTNPAILVDGEEVFEGIMDAVLTSACAIPGLQSDNPRKNSRAGSIYIVKPKQHGSAEVAFTNDLFASVEELLGLEKNTLKVGVMDEERRTSANLAAAITAVSERVAFINTGFLDRTGDEIHTSMQAGPMVRKADMQTAPWKQAYEDINVDTGVALGLPGKAQIGKGMWAMTELMADMLDKKIGQLKEGASTAWVPSPTGATLHATHYHHVNVPQVQEEFRKAGERDNFHNLLTVPVAENPDWSDEVKKEEVDNNCQSILGYVVRWVEQGVGCSKVPDLYDVSLMEDRATLRISSQLLANWIEHDVVSKDFVEQELQKMAEVVDKQNAGDDAYRNMAPNFDESVAFQAARDLIFKGTESPSGYTEPILHARRREFKAKNG